MILEKISEVVFIVKTIGEWNNKELAMTVGIDRIKPFEADAIPSPSLKLTANSVLPYDMFAEHNNNNPERAPDNRNDHHMQPTQSRRSEQATTTYNYTLYRLGCRRQKRRYTRDRSDYPIRRQ